ncbi:NADPH-dependent aldehyde reductase-like protein, chloroplastic [Cucurbita pepo subsp. pepo]|uniref:NADPH-dependent aldehyde reductase-like protein, chloroplastic n=1 Tax=Cucurbita pepo subsp. pepo TaxID=3664 RepID=UPI000C9D48DB|nr:NADPH-dependent aldehyde reductase-like protein, chloroplastic [Cucurbita pepo subsp. pepo]
MASESGPAVAALPLQDRVVIVTGASRGIGRAIAFHLAALGARIVVNYVSSSAKADRVAAEINSSSATGSGLRAIAWRADVSDPEQVKSLFDTAEQRFGAQVHIMVNCAGISDPTYPYIADTSLEIFDQIFSVNTRGSFLCCREAANRVKRGGGGRIILISSTAVAAATAGIGAYTASKAAVEAMTKVAAKEMRGSKITVNCIAPGATATEMLYGGMDEEAVKRVIEKCPLGRVGEPKDVASFVGFLASDEGEWINGQVMLVNGGIV